MSILLKKITSAISAAAIAFVAVAPSITNAASGFAPYADALAKASIITTQSNEAGYRLADNAMRQEVAAIMMALSKATYEANYSCAGKFADVSATKPNSWVCKVVETALSKGLIAANATFRPEDNTTRAEALAMILRGQGIEITTGGAASFNDTPVTWQKDVANTALTKKLISSNASFRPNALITRGELFVMAANAAGLEIASASDDLNLDDLFGDTGTGTTATGTTDTPVVVKAGDLNVVLAASTPAAATIPANVSGIVVAKFDLTAGSNDISVNSIKLKRVGLGDSNTLSALALSTAAGRISKAKNENSSDDTVDFALTSTLVVKAGSTVTVDVLASVPPIGTNPGGDEFAVQLLELTSSAAKVNMNMVVGNTMKVASIDAAGLTVDNDGTTAAVKVGETNKEVYKFKITNGSNDEDMMLSSITLKETGTADDMVDFANWKLYMDGTEIATTAKSLDKYITFNMTAATTLKASKIVKFVVKADIVGGAGKTVLVSLDSTLDVTAVGTKYGYGVGVTDNSTGAAVNIDAGELVLGAIDAPSTTIKENKKDVILGKIKVTSNAGKNLELQQFKVTVTNSFDDGASTPDAYFENVELYDETNGTVYDLTRTAIDTNSDYYADADLNIALPATGSVTFAIRADTRNISGGTLTNFASSAFSLAVATGTPGFYVVETEDDIAVSDITPSSMTFKTIEGSTASAIVSVIPMSTAKTAVIGSADVEALTFEVKADDSSDLTLTEVKVKNTAAITTTVDAMDNSRVTEVKLYKDSVSDANLLDRVSGSQIATNIATFDGFNVAIAKNASQRFVVTTSIVDDQNNNGDELQLALNSLSLDDEDNDDVTVDLSVEATYTSARILTIAGAGTLTTTVDNTDSETDKTKNVLGNTTSPFVASYELTATNEAVKIKDLNVVAVGADFVNAVSEIVLYKNDKTTEIARKSVTSTTTTFTAVNYVVAEGSENMYVKVVTRKIGKDAAGKQTGDLTLAIDVTSAEGNESNKVVVDTAQTAASNAFAVLPTKISNIAFVDSASGTSRATILNSGTNNVAIIAVTTDSSTNSSTTGGSLKTKLKQVKVNVSKLTSAAGTAITGMTIEKINGNEGTTAGTLLNGAAGATFGANDTPVSATFNISALTSDNLIDNGTTVYYVVKATVTKDATSDKDDYVKVSFDALNASQVVYTADSAIAGLADVTDLRIGLTKLDGTQINE